MFLFYGRKIKGFFGAAPRFLVFARRLIFFAAAFFGQAFFISCADNFFEDFEVKNSFFAGKNVLVEFSAAVDPSSAKENFLFAQDDVQVDGEMTFLGSSILFVPAKEICENHSYKVHVFSGIRDLKGNSLQRDYVNLIHTKSDLARPKILSAKIEGENLVIQFSKAIDQKSFLDSFSIEPQKDFFARWSPGREKVEIAFMSPLAQRTVHSIKIKAGLLDERNNKMENDFFWSWTNAPDAPFLECALYGHKVGCDESICMNGVFENADFDKPFKIEFNKEVDSESALSAVSAEENFSLEKTAQRSSDGKLCKSVLVKFKTRPKWNEAALLCVDGSHLEKNGALGHLKVVLVNGAEERRPPLLEFMAAKANGKLYVIGRDDFVADISFDTAEYPDGEEKDFPLYFVYSISAAAKTIDRLSAMEATKVLSSSCAAIHLKALECAEESGMGLYPDFSASQKAQGKILSLKASSKKLALVKFDATFRNLQKDGRPARGVIDFKVSQKLCDDLKNYMEEVAGFACNKN